MNMNDKKTKIVCTIGPKTESEEMLQNIVKFYFEEFETKESAYRRERQVKSWKSKKKILILRCRLENMGGTDRKNRK